MCLVEGKILVGQDIVFFSLLRGTQSVSRTPSISGAVTGSERKAFS